ncbi:MAG: response regulator [Oceanococcus sp.]
MSWKVLVVDDDIDINRIIQAYLEPLLYIGSPVSVLSANSALEAKALFAEQDDIAVAFIDLQMETNSAGLDLIHHLRAENITPHTRIFLLTGNTDRAPRWETTQKFDLDGYLDKAQIDPESILASTYSAIRSYDLISRLDTSRQSIFNAVRMLKALDEADQGAHKVEAIISRLIDSGESLHTEADWSWDSNDQSHADYSNSNNKRD